MGWRTVVVNTHSKLSYKNNHLIFKDASRTELIHLSEVDILLLETTDIVLSTMLIKRLVDENILVIFCDDKRLPTAMLMPYYARHDSSLQLSNQITWSEDVKAEVWTTIIAQKILNQAMYLGDCGFFEKSQSVIDLYNGLELFDPSNREGHAARIYFNTLFGNDFSREQDNDINAALDYGYTLILSMFAREVVVCGCMTQFGLKHANQFNQFNLASDVMEPFRPIIDRIVYENRNNDFVKIKRELFTIFSDTFLYNGKEMYLSNIVSDYTKKVIKTLNQTGKGVPEFRI
ncbi:MAG: type II CRISPR-associated endonuclease Cas1 [Streptococcus mutans]|uniref:CRISPR-associated endonuclease Cas1 n=2 Tax=Streptococcus anginosus TaxID=1328 RepID=A0ABD4U5G6_STRAP|nr:MULTISPECIES: type II CRISPR-associated endonuclease Cas1 [Streptococcus]EJP26014.1 CRISPR-associated endonuclease Cas1, subtype II/NMENI [Streptococcus anginosus SK1138]KAA9298196.1 type II CRISPR-associated endonuclease Cas1 [Streptococcus anginosus]KUM01083.1 type II CRISPR-associated endonuclease Cas1 [Streptococcus anginosus]MCW1059718.1 type II CRISPR-associated endonuclease Cas1 [Streptococcus anginosus]MCW1077300.1 type II CRISPR-associated endonuclease Cas1 [Streptococcus anginosus